ncbi:MAG: hypothetical protein QM813_11605 [Verrucomicrobiota bacterium]
MAIPPRLDEPSPTYGTNAGEFYFIRDGNQDKPATVFFSMSGTGKGGVNFTALPMNVTFRANEGTVSLPVRPLRDSKSTVDVTAVLTITRVTGYQIDPSNGVAVLDDYQP